MIAHVVERPQLRSNRFVAHLLRCGDVIGLDLAVGMVGTDSNPNLAGGADEHDFSFTARIFSHRFDLSSRRPVRRGNAMVDWRGRRTSNAGRFELNDMLLTRHRIAPGPAGIDRSLQRDGTRCDACAVVHAECQGHNGHEIFFSNSNAPPIRCGSRLRTDRCSKPRRLRMDLPGTPHTPRTTPATSHLTPDPTANQTKRT